LLVVVLAMMPAHAGVKRYALLVGANAGWSQDQPLRYAQEDARRLAAVLTEMGDFPAEEVVLLEEPTTERIREELARAREHLRTGDEQSLFLFYYSGHADERHLHLRGSPLSFAELQEHLQGMPAKVKIGIIDACQSGALLSVKGGRPTQAFKVVVQDELELHGTAFLTSSGADEISQESRALAGSFFSHHLVSGLRGAADEDGDGLVGLREVYDYAYGRTLLDTAGTPAGVQRPRFQYELRGQGEMHLTRLQRSGALLLFPRESHCFVTDVGERRLLAEVATSLKAGAQLALPAGEYVLKCDPRGRYRAAAFRLQEGERLEVEGLAFRDVPPTHGVLKGGGGRISSLDMFRREGFQKLIEGRPEEALVSFERVLQRDRRDQEAYRGKAEALLALARKAGQRGQQPEMRRLMEDAIRTDPRVQQSPAFASLREATSTDDEPGLRRLRAAFGEHLWVGHPPQIFSSSKGWTFWTFSRPSAARAISTSQRR
jgi:hypothetical protein